MLFSWSQGGGPRGPLLQLCTVCLILPPKHGFFMRISLWPGAKTQIEFRSIRENRRRQRYIRLKLDKLRIPQRGPRGPLSTFGVINIAQKPMPRLVLRLIHSSKSTALAQLQSFAIAFSNLSLLPRKVVSIAQAVKLPLGAMARYSTITFLPTKFEDTTLAKCNSLRQEARFFCIPLSQ